MLTCPGSDRVSLKSQRRTRKNSQVHLHMKLAVQLSGKTVMVSCARLSSATAQEKKKLAGDTGVDVGTKVAVGSFAACQL